MDRLWCLPQCDVYLAAMGRSPNTPDALGLEAAGVTLNRGAVIVDRGTLATQASGVYAAGDVIGPPSLASTGVEQAQRAVQCMFHEEVAVAVTVIATVIATANR